MRRDFPMSFFWGVLLVVLGIGTALTYRDLGSVIFNVLAACAGAYLAWRGWRIAEARPRRG